jgi:hypothetical protein
MSQKINPIIYRLGTKTSWVSKYCEKKRHELKNLSFNELQLTKFIKLFFKKTGLQLKNCKIYYKKNSLHFFLIYDIIKLKLKNLILIKHKLSNELKFFKNLYKKNPVIFNIMQLKNIYKLKKKNSTNYKHYLKFLHFFSKKNKKYKKLFKNCFKFTKYLEKRNYIKFCNSINKKLNLIHLKKFFILKFVNLLKIKKVNTNFIIGLFFKKILSVVTVFLKKNINLFLLTKQLNKNNFVNISHNQKFKLLINLVNLKKFQNNTFFELGVNLLFNSFYNKINIAFLISDFIKTELSKIKDSKFFNSFLKFLFNNIKYFLFIFKKIKGIEIKIKGNLTKKQRAVVKTIILGKKVPKLLINNNLKFNESTAYTKKGTFGIKVWVYFFQNYAKWF